MVPEELARLGAGARRKPKPLGKKSAPGKTAPEDK
jgi:hypothetical protein